MVNNILTIETFSNTILWQNDTPIKYMRAQKKVDVFLSLDIREHIAMVSVAEIVDIFHRTFSQFSKGISSARRSNREMTIEHQSVRHTREIVSWLS